MIDNTHDGANSWGCFNQDIVTDLDVPKYPRNSKLGHTSDVSLAFQKSDFRRIFL